jgi:sugar phosphate isomerase/epimerase
MKSASANRYISALITSLPMDFAAALSRIRELGFSYVDLVGLSDRPQSDREALAESGLIVSCTAIGRGLPGEQQLDSSSIKNCRAAVQVMKRQLADAASLGATHCYVVPGMDSSLAGVLRFTDACRHLADFAGQRMMRFCVEHCPGRALPSVAATLHWLDHVGHPNLSLLLDVGHCLISNEEPADAVSQAGHRLGYVHLDDNDGVGDLHWPLLTGGLTEGMLKRTLGAFQPANYTGGLALELNANNPEPEVALRDGKLILERLLR